MNDKTKGTSLGEELRAGLIAVLSLAAGIAVVSYGKNRLHVEGDAIYVALLLVSVVVYLALTDKLKKLSVGGLTTEFHNRVDELEKNVTGKVNEIGAYETEKSAYFGKLQLVMEKDGRNFCLIYADVDGLRARAREIYLAEKQKSERPGHEAGTYRSVGRRTEKQIRGGIIEELGFATADAFSEAAGTVNAKYDMFFLEEPDLVMIARSVTLELARSVAQRGLELFQHRHQTTATTAVLSPAQMASHATPQQLHEAAAKRLNNGKDLGRGKVYAGP